MLASLNLLRLIEYTNLKLPVLKIEILMVIVFLSKIVVVNSFA